MECHGCRQNHLGPGNFLRCHLCGGQYHFECLRLKESQFKALSSEYLSSWTCPACANVGRRARSNLNTPVRQSLVAATEGSHDMSCEYSDMDSTLPSHSQQPQAVKTADKDNVITMKKISDLFDTKLNSLLKVHMDGFRSALKEDVKALVRAELDVAFQSLKDDFSTTTDFICEEQKTLKVALDNKTKLISNLETENAQLRNQMQKINARLASMEKISRSHNLELQAVPEAKNENVVALFNKLCEIVNVPLDPLHVHACRRIAKLNPSSNRPRTILVTLSSSLLRDKIISAVHRYNKKHPKETLDSSLFGFTGETRKIYVAENLSPEQKQLHAAARKVSKDKNYNYVWVKFGNIYMRKNDSTAAILIKNEDTLKNLI